MILRASASSLERMRRGAEGGRRRGPLMREGPGPSLERLPGLWSGSGLVGADIVPESRLELEFVGEAAAEAGDLDPLSQADERDLERVDPGGAVDEDRDRAGA